MESNQYMTQKNELILCLLESIIYSHAFASH